MRATNDEKRRESPEKTATQATTTTTSSERSRPNHGTTTSGVRARPTESKKATTTPTKATETKSQTAEQSQQQSHQPQEPPLIVRVRDTSPPDPELLSKIGCRCLVIDLPGVLAEMLTVTYRGGFVRVEGQRTVGRLKAFRKKFPLNHEQVVTRMLSAFLNHGVLVIVTPTKVAASMAAAAMVAAQIASKGYQFPTTMNPPSSTSASSASASASVTTTTPPASHNDHIPRKPRPLLLMQDPAEIGQPVKFSNDVQITAGTTTAAPQPKSAFGPYQIDTTSTNMLDGETILSDEEEPPSISIPPIPSKQPRKFFFTTGLPRSKLQKYPSDESGSGHLHRYPSDERTNKSRSIRIEQEEEGPAFEEKKTDDGERLQGNVSWTDTSLSDEPSDVVRSHAHAKAQAQAHTHAHAATPPRRRSIEEYDVILEDRLTMLSPIREEQPQPQPQQQQEHNNGNRELQASSPVASTSTTSSGANNRPLTWVQFEENVWPDNAENMMVRSNSDNNNDQNNNHDTTTTTKTLELTYQHHYAYHHYDDDEKDAERKRLLLGMHGNPDGLLEQRGIMLPFEDELMDDREDDRSLRMELEPHPYWRSAPFLPPRLETIDYVSDTSRAVVPALTSDSSNNNMIVREPQKVPSPSLLRRNRLSARKTVTWVDEI